LLRIVKKNSNDIVTGDLVCHLWDNFKRCPRFAVQSHHHHHQGDESMHKEQEKLNLNQPSGDNLTPMVGYHH
jgi:hypothetical protein